MVTCTGSLKEEEDAQRTGKPIASTLQRRRYGKGMQCKASLTTKRLWPEGRNQACAHAHGLHLQHFRREPYANRCEK